MLHFMIFINKGSIKGIESFRMNSKVDYSLLLEEIVNAHNCADIAA